MIVMSPAKILIVDDDPVYTQMVRGQLKAKGYECHCVREGIRAVQAAQRMQPDLIILDLKMPAGDGLFVLKSLRNLMDTADIPVIIVSAMARDVAKIELCASGAQDYVEKSRGIDDLLLKVHLHLNGDDEIRLVSSA